MGSRIFTKRLVVIAGCLGLLAALVILGSWYLFGRGQLTIQRAGNLSWGWTKAAGVNPAGQHVLADQGEVLVIWCADAPGPNDVTLESRLFGYRFNPKGFFTLPGGKR